jgi:oxygen-independent coproporphyrinogen-3 oxidase
MVKHLYIHIPFCESICSYCDFCRFVSNVQTKKKYIEKVVMQIKSKFDVHNKLDSIYIGGGTPNSLSQDLLHTLLCECKKFCKKNTEFTIECNPEFVNDKQIKVFKKYKINRVSLGVQSTNNALLKRINRKHTYEDVVNAVKLLQKNKIKNISCDFIYGFNETTKKELDDALAFISKYSIPHYSFYSLETKPNSLITKQGYSINIEKQEKDLQYIEKKSKYTRYEVSN